MMDVNWDEAPEGATHVIFNDNHAYAHWRKIEDGVVHCYYPGGWDDMGVPADRWLERHAHVIIERPPKENPLPNGLRWVDKATHYYSNNIIPLLFFNEKGYTTSKIGSKWIEWEGGLFEWYMKQAGTTARYPLGQPMKVEQPKPRKPVGWWS